MTWTCKTGFSSKSIGLIRWTNHYLTSSCIHNHEYMKPPRERVLPAYCTAVRTQGEDIVELGSICSHIFTSSVVVVKNPITDNTSRWYHCWRSCICICRRHRGQYIVMMTYDQVFFSRSLSLVGVFLSCRLHIRRSVEPPTTPIRAPKTGGGGRGWGGDKIDAKLDRILTFHMDRHK